MRIILTTTFLFTTLYCFAQRQNVYFLKNSGEYVKVRDSADYIRIIREPDSASTLYNVFEYYPNGKVKLMGKSSTIIPQKLEGSCVTFYKNGNKKNVLNYKGGRLSGVQYEFYPDGKLYVTSTYPENPDLEKSYDDFLITAESDSSGNVLVSDGNGYYKGFDDKFKTVVEEGNLKDGKRDGHWEGINEGSHIKFKERYENGNFISGISFGETGDSVTYTIKAREPQYKGGLKAFYSYIANNVHYPDYERANNIQGKVILSFIVEKDGGLTNIKVMKSVSENIDAEALRVLKESRNWMPGMQYGRSVRVSYTIPLNFALSN